VDENTLKEGIQLIFKNKCENSKFQCLNKANGRQNSYSSIILQLQNCLVYNMPRDSIMKDSIGIQELTKVIINVSA